MKESRYICPILDDGLTHRFWWTWIPAHPLSRDECWYRILENVFSDHTTNCMINGAWQGAYKEGNEVHQTVGIFHSFSALPTLHWAEALLDRCSIPFIAPVTQVRWQYHLRDSQTYREADIALRVVDATGPDSEFAVVFEAKRKGGKLKPADKHPECYLQITPLIKFKKKHVCFIVDESDQIKFAQALPGYAVGTWQMIKSIQLNEIHRLIMPSAAKEHLRSLMRSHINWYLDKSAFNSVTVGQQLDTSDLTPLNDRVAALLRGLEIVVRTRKKLTFFPPIHWFEQERTVVEYRELKEKKDFSTPVW